MGKCSKKYCGRINPWSYEYCIYPTQPIPGRLRRYGWGEDKYLEGIDQSLFPGDSSVSRPVFHCYMCPERIDSLSVCYLVAITSGTHCDGISRHFFFPNTLYMHFNAIQISIMEQAYSSGTVREKSELLKVYLFWVTNSESIEDIKSGIQYMMQSVQQRCQLQ